MAETICAWSNRMMFVRPMSDVWCLSVWCHAPIGQSSANHQQLSANHHQSLANHQQSSANHRLISGESSAINGQSSAIIGHLKVWCTFGSPGGATLPCRCNLVMIKSPTPKNCRTARCCLSKWRGHQVFGLYMHDNTFFARMESIIGVLRLLVALVHLPKMDMNKSIISGILGEVFIRNRYWRTRICSIN